MQNNSGELVHSENYYDKSQVLLEPYKYLLEIPGKGVRSRLILAFNQWLQIDKTSLTAISEIIDMLHTASLLVDDIEDNSKLRRGVPVAHLIYGVPATINCANYVYFLALEKCSNLAHTSGINNNSCTSIFIGTLP